MIAKVPPSPITYIATLLLAAGPCIAAWTKQGLKNEAEPEECNCSAITGIVGLNYGIETHDSFDGSGGLESTGGIAAIWDGIQPTVCDHPKVDEADSYVEHVWTEGAAVVGVARARLIGMKLVEGYAKRHDTNDPSWWWDCSAVLRANHPVVKATTDGTTWGSGTGMVPTALPVYECWTRAKDVPNNNSSGGTSRIDHVHAEGDTSHPDTSYNLPLMGVLGWQVKVHLQSTGGPVSGDNVEVKLEKAQLQFIFSSWWGSL